GRPLVIRDVALALEFASIVLHATRQKFRWKSLHMDGSLSRHDSCRTDVLAASRRGEPGHSGAPAASRHGNVRTGCIRGDWGNHVHFLLRPLGETSRALQWIKGTTAREANQLLARTGNPFWQRESYHHWVRDESQMSRIVAYIENNPVTAGLA